MHEASLMENALAIVAKTAEEHNVKEIKKIKLKVGKMANCIPGALEFAFEASRKNQPWEKAELELIEDPAVGLCSICNEKTVVSGFPWKCQFCGSNELDIVAGLDVYVESIEIDD